MMESSLSNIHKYSNHAINGMEIQYLWSAISPIIWIYTNRMKILDFSIYNRVGKWTIGLIILPVMLPIAIYKIGYWIKTDPLFKKIIQNVKYQTMITDFMA